MVVGVSATEATDFLNLYRNTAGTARTPFAELRTGDPGATGVTANISVGDPTRRAVTWNAPSAGSMTLSALAAYTNGGTSETITHIALWSAVTAGVFLQSFALSAGQAWVSTNTLTIATFTVSFTPIAA